MSGDQEDEELNKLLMIPGTSARAYVRLILMKVARA
jgi:hypothetical protein